MTAAQAPGQDKKDKDKKNPDHTKKESYDEFVTVRPLIDANKAPTHGNPLADRPACRGEIKGKTVFWVQKVSALDARKGSIIIDKAGGAYEITESKSISGNFAYQLCYVTKKPDEKKPGEKKP